MVATASGSAVPGAELLLLHVGARPHGVRLAAVAVPAGLHVVVVAAVLVQPRVAHPVVPLLLLLLPVEARVVPRWPAPAAAVFRVRLDAVEVSSGASCLLGAGGGGRHVGGRPAPTAAVFGERRPDAFAVATAASYRARRLHGTCGGRHVGRRRRQLLGVAVHATAEVVRRVVLLGAAVEPVPTAAAAARRGARERRRGIGVRGRGVGGHGRSLVGLNGGFRGTRGLAEEEAATAPRVRRARRRDGEHGH